MRSSTGSKALRDESPRHVSSFRTPSHPVSSTWLQRPALRDTYNTGTPPWSPRKTPETHQNATIPHIQIHSNPIPPNPTIDRRESLRSSLPVPCPCPARALPRRLCLSFRPGYSFGLFRVNSAPPPPRCRRHVKFPCISLLR